MQQDKSRVEATLPRQRMDGRHVESKLHRSDYALVYDKETTTAPATTRLLRNSLSLSLDNNDNDNGDDDDHYNDYDDNKIITLFIVLILSPR